MTQETKAVTKATVLRCIVRLDTPDLKYPLLGTVCPCFEGTLGPSEKVHRDHYCCPPYGCRADGEIGV